MTKPIAIEVESGIASYRLKGNDTMARCEDFPCCGHEMGLCPDYDPITGEQLNMKCVCGATVPLTSRYSLCAGCLASDDGADGDWGRH
jgi:hypothetical protein